MKAAEDTDIDGLIKLILATLLAVLPFYMQNPASFEIFFVYLFVLTVLSRIKPRTLLLSASSYFIIVLMPYFFGLVLNGFISLYSKNLFPLDHHTSKEIVLRLLRLFIVWFVSILYFQTTPIKTVLGLVEKLLYPLKRLGVPVEDYLKVIMCVVSELKDTGSEVKKSLEKSMRSVIGGEKRGFTLNLKGIAQIIVSLIVNSFEKTGRIEELVARIGSADFSHYHFKVTKKEIAIFLSFFLLLLPIFAIERGLLHL